MRSKLMEDGVTRILAKVEVPVTSREIALHAMTNPSLSEYANPLHGIEKLNKRQIFSLAKDSIREYGTRNAEHTVTKLWKKDHIERVIAYVAEQFPECD